MFYFLLFKFLFLVFTFFVHLYLEMNYTYFQPETLYKFIREVFGYYGVPDEDAHLAADVLLYSDLRGIDSHGVARMQIYTWMLEQGRVNPKANISIVRDRKSVATIDGDNGLGLIVAPKAYKIAMQKAKDFGSGWVAVCNTNHYGAAGYYVEEALKQDLIGMSMTNSSKVVAPLWGVERMLGTNPIAIGFPGKEEPPVIVDFATSAVSFGKVEIQWRKGESLPPGWAIQKDGQSSNKPEDFLDDAALLPLGSEKIRGGHKGYGLGSMVDILTAILSGANWGPFAPPFAIGHDIPDPVGKGIGHFLGAWDIESFRDVEEFKSQIDHWVRTMRGTKPMPGKEAVLIPGDPERAALAERKKTGIPVIEAVVRDMEEIGRKTGVGI